MIKIYGDRVDHHQNKKYSKNGQYSIKYSSNGLNKIDFIKHNFYSFHNYVIHTNKSVEKYSIKTRTYPHSINHIIVILLI